MKQIVGSDTLTNFGQTHCAYCYVVLVKYLSILVHLGRFKSKFVLGSNISFHIHLVLLICVSRFNICMR